LKVSAYDIASGWRKDLDDQKVILGENRSTELWSGSCPEPPLEEAYDKVAPSGTVVIHARLVDEDGTVIARFSDWPQPYKLLDLPNPGLTIEQSKGEVKLKVGKPAKGVWLSVQGDDEGVKFGNNSLDLFPGDEQVVTVKGMEGRVVTAAWLGGERAKIV
jgi:beta-mannosidase